MTIGLRNARIDVLRGLSILLVLFHHFNIAYPLKNTVLATVPGLTLVHAVARNGNYGVTIFFVISGFLITGNAIRRWGSLAQVEPAAFYRLRIARIVPCVVLLLLVVNLLAAAGLTMFRNKGFGEVPLPMWEVNLAAMTFWMNTLIGRHGWVNYPLGVLWSLSVEEMFYLAFPLLCLLLRSERRLMAFWALVIVIGPWYRLVHQGDEGGFLYAGPACFDGIAIGCCAAVLSLRHVFPWLTRRPVRAVVLSAMVLLYLGWPIARSNVPGVTLMALGTALLLLGATPGASPAGAGARAVAACGRLSYELYLFHLIVLGLLRTAFLPALASGNQKLGLMAGYFVLSGMLAYAIATFYAGPLNRALRQRRVPTVGRGQR